MLKLRFVCMGLFVIAMLSACAKPTERPKPINAIYLNSSHVKYSVKNDVHADSIRVKDLQGNTICYKKDVNLTPPQTSVGFGFCTVVISCRYVVETKIGENTYLDGIYAAE